MEAHKSGRVLVALLLLLPGTVSFAPLITRQKWSWSLGASETITESILDAVHKQHDLEVSNSFKIWGRSSADGKISGTPVAKQWADTDFVFRSVGVQNAGPDESMMKHGDHLFSTVERVVSLEECDALIKEAKEVIDRGLENDGSYDSDNAKNNQPTNSQLGEARLSQMPKASKWLRSALHERFFPILESRFGVPARELTLNDALIIGYGYFGNKARSQPVHRDADLLSLNVALSTQEEYDPDGGGTFFEGLPARESVIKTDKGHVLCHSGGAPHAGRGIAHGERWVLVLFCIAENYPQLSRRCHAKGMIEKQQGKLDEAKAAFRAGLSMSPNDHLLLSSMGGTFMAEGNENKARGFLSATAGSYKHCQKANLALARMFLANGKPRASLRRFDSVLDYLDDLDLDSVAWMPLKAMGWDARVYGSHAAILCAMKAKKTGLEFDSSLHLQRAMKRLQVALSAVPADERILAMMDKVEELLSQED